ncbi:MAG: hypothetical protein JNL79_18695 [Myxococcales bacterium]|nr:hypothetical protein [Myxococcales bacterium]
MKNQQILFVCALNVSLATALLSGCAPTRDEVSEITAQGFGVTRFRPLGTEAQAKVFVGEDQAGNAKVVALYDAAAAQRAAEDAAASTDDDQDLELTRFWRVALPAEVGLVGDRLGPGAADAQLSLPLATQTEIVRALFNSWDPALAPGELSTQRKYGARQSCDDAKMKALETDMHTLCDNRTKRHPRKCSEADGCAAAEAKVSNNCQCKAQRIRVTAECFYGKWDEAHRAAVYSVNETGNVCVVRAKASCASTRVKPFSGLGKCG